MKINFYTEMDFEGKISRNYENMRTEFSWMVMLNATHYPITNLLDSHEKSDLSIIIIPKTGLDKYLHYNLIELAHKYSDKVAIMQEGPTWSFQDLPLEQQVWYYNTLMDVDFLLCHNERDKLYYRGLTNKLVYTMPSLMITDNIIPSPVQNNDVIIGGNMCSWYGGFSSMIVAQEFDLPIYAPSMGRKIDGEDELNIKYLPYMNWLEWMTELSTFKVGIHLMRTFAAGTFALNCAYWGIPCIGYSGLDTQQILHPLTTIDVDDLEHANELTMKLQDDKFYKLCSETTKKRYNEYYTEKSWLKHWKEIENVI